MQRRFSKRLYGLCSLSYVERLNVLGAETLELRRLKFDLLMVFKIIHKLVCIDFYEFFALNGVIIMQDSSHLHVAVLMHGTRYLHTLSVLHRFILLNWVLIVIILTVF